MSTTQNVTDLDNELNAQILKGDILGAFDRFYDKDVVMQENTDEPTAGFDANRKKEEAFVGSIEAFHGAALLNSAVTGNIGFSEWEFDATYKGAGRVKLTQVARREWANGKVVNERFYYSKH